ncbi:MAG: hypothetical protein ABGZ17_15780, partial [Planctomycetaceae bacterium]
MAAGVEGAQSTEEALAVSRERSEQDRAGRLLLKETVRAQRLHAQREQLRQQGLRSGESLIYALVYKHGMAAAIAHDQVIHASKLEGKLNWNPTDDTRWIQVQMQVRSVKKLTPEQSLRLQDMFRQLRAELYRLSTEGDGQ